MGGAAFAADEHAANPSPAPAAAHEAPVKKTAPPAAPAAPSASATPAAAHTPVANAKEAGALVREAVDSGVKSNKRLTLKLNENDKDKKAGQAKAQPPRPEYESIHPALPAVPGRIENPVASRQSSRAKAAALARKKAAAHGGEAHWSYEGDTGPQAWAGMKPEFSVCAIGKRQSPINIEESNTLRGPAEALQFDYQPSSGTVVNNGHTIQVDVQGDNSITVRGATYKLLQFHFHRPSEEQVNSKNFAMVAHLVHKNDMGQLAVVAVLLDSGSPNLLVNKVWTYMPLDTGDRVQMPPDWLNMNDLLPSDQRYYQFMGSLTTPPCTENVLWMVFKTPSQVGRDQIKLFSQLFPHNARPVQPVNGRPVRDAQ